MRFRHTYGKCDGCPSGWTEGQGSPADCGGGGAGKPPTPPSAILGCTDPRASNYNPNATQEDNSCMMSAPPMPENPPKSTTTPAPPAPPAPSSKFVDFDGEANFDERNRLDFDGEVE